MSTPFEVLTADAYPRALNTSPNLSVRIDELRPSRPSAIKLVPTSENGGLMKHAARQ